MARLLGEARVSVLPDGTRFKTEAEAIVKKAQAGLNASVKLNLDDATIQAKLKGINAQIDKLKATSANIEIKGDDKQLQARLATIKAQLDKLTDRLYNVKTDADISALMAKIATADSALEKLINQKNVKLTLDEDTAMRQATDLRTKIGALFSDLKAKIGLGDKDVEADAIALRERLKLIFSDIKIKVTENFDDAKANFEKFLKGAEDEAGGSGGRSGNMFGNSFAGGLARSALMQNPGITGLIIAGLGALPAAVGAVGVLGGIALGAGLIFGAESMIKSQLKSLTADMKTATTTAASKTASPDAKKAADEALKSDQQQIDMLSKELAAFQKVNDAVTNLKDSFLKFAIVVTKPLIKPFADALNDLAGQLNGPLATAFTKLFKAVGPLVKPVVDSLLSLVKDVLPGLTDMLNRARQPLSDMFETFGKVVGLNLGKWFEDAIPFIKDSGRYLNVLIEGLGMAGGLLIKFGGGIAQAFQGSGLKGLGGLIGQMGTDIVKILIPAFQGWVAVMGPVAKDIALILTPLLNFLASNPGVVKAIAGIAATFYVLAKALTFARAAVVLFGLSTDVVMPWLAVIGLVAIAALLIVKYWGPIKNFFIKIWQDIYNGSAKYFLLLLGPIGEVALAAIEIVKHWGTISSFFVGLWKEIWGHFFGPLIDLFTKTVPQAAATVGNALKLAWTKVYTNTVDAWNNTFNFLKETWGHIENAFTGVFKPIASVLEGIWNQIYKMTRDTWGFIYAFVKGILQIIYGTLVQTWRGLKQATEDAWNWIFNITKDLWGHIENAITGIVKPLVSWLKGAWAQLKGDAQDAWNWIFNITKDVWGHIENVIMGIVKPLVNWLKGAWAQAKGDAQDAWNWIFNTTKDVWGHIENVVTGIVKPMVNWLKGAWAQAKGDVQDAWNWIFNISKDVWGRIENAVTGIVKPMISVINGLWNTLKGWTSAAFNWISNEIINPMQRALNWVIKNFVPGIKGAFQGAVNGVKDIWATIEGAVKGPISWVVDHVYNDAIVPFWNNTAGIVGGKHLTNITGFATGGKIPGWDNGDKQHAILEGGEAVVPKRLASSADFSNWAGYHGIPGYAKGGKLPGGGGGGQGSNAGGRAGALGAQNPTGDTVNLNPLSLVKDAWDKVKQLGGDALAGVFSHIINPLISQISGFTGNAAKNSPIATAPKKIVQAVETELVNWIKGHDSNDDQSGGSGSMLQFMLSQKGKKYSQAARFGPNSWDCSGLVWGAAHASGVPMPGGPSDNSAAIVNPELQWAGSQGGAKVMHKPSNKDVKSGDLLGFTGSVDDHVTGNAKMMAGFKLKIGNIVANSMGHIGMAMSPGQFMSAYDTAVGCEPEPIDYPNLEVAVRMAGGGGAAATGDGKTADDRGKEIISFLAANLFNGNMIAAAGAAASMYGEALNGWDPESVGTGGWGIFGQSESIPGTPSQAQQQTGDRAKDMATQLKALLTFVSYSGDSGAISAMEKATTVGQAANIWGPKVERFGINDVHQAGIDLATQLMHELGGKGDAGNAGSGGSQAQKEAAAEAALGYASGGFVDLFGSSNTNRLSPYVKHAHRNSGIEGDWATKSNARFPGDIAGSYLTMLWQGYNDISGGTSASAVKAANSYKIGVAHKAGIPVLMGGLQQGATKGKDNLAIAAYNKWAETAADGYVSIGSQIPKGTVHANAAQYTSIAKDVDGGIDAVMKKVHANEDSAINASKATQAAAAKTAAAKVAATTADNNRIKALGLDNTHGQLEDMAANYTAKLNDYKLKGKTKEYTSTLAALSDVNAAMTKWPTQQNAIHDQAAAAYKVDVANEAKYGNGKGKTAEDKKLYAVWHQKALANAGKISSMDTILNAYAAGTMTTDTTSLGTLSNKLYTSGDMSKIGNQLKNNSLNPDAEGGLTSSDMKTLALNITNDALDAMYANSGGQMFTALTADLAGTTGVGNVATMLPLLGKAVNVHGTAGTQKFSNGGLLPPGAGYGVVGGVPISFNEGGKRERIVPDRGTGNADVVSALMMVKDSIDNNTRVTQMSGSQQSKAVGGIGRLMNL